MIYQILATILTGVASTSVIIVFLSKKFQKKEDEIKNDYALKLKEIADKRYTRDLWVQWKFGMAFAKAQYPPLLAGTLKLVYLAEDCEKYPIGRWSISVDMLKEGGGHLALMQNSYLLILYKDMLRVEVRAYSQDFKPADDMFSVHHKNIS